MKLNELLQLIRSQDGIFSSNPNNSIETIVSIDNFFKECDPKTYRFAANSGLTTSETYAILKKIQLCNEVYDVSVIILEEYEEDEKWAYSESCIISTSLNKDFINNFFSSDSGPTEITEINNKDNRFKNLPKIKDGYSSFICWWD